MDIFEREQDILEKAFLHIVDVRNGAPLKPDVFELLANEYGKLLKHVRRVTKISDKNTSELFIRNADLANKVHHDPLTGIYNRRFLDETLIKNIKELSRSGSVLSVLMIDIDYFKKYNDTYGHNEGDVCLIAVADTLINCVTRKDDYVTRYGGEEFVIILPYTSEQGAHYTADRIQQKIYDRNIPHEKNEVSNRITVSIGVTTVMVKHTDNAVDYIKCADTALYMSKQNGRNRYTFRKYDEHAR